MGVEVLFVSPEMAKDWLENSKYRGQRPIIKDAVERYVRSMKNGEWILGESAVVIGRRDHYDGSSSYHLLNAQQRLTAVAESGLGQRFIINRQWFKSDAEMDAAYAVYDGGAKRTLSHRLAALELHDLLGVTDTQLSKALVAIKLIKNEFGKKAGRTVKNVDMSPKFITEAFEEWGTAIYAYNQAIKGASGPVRRALNTGPATALGLVTFRYAPHRAQNFWHTIAIGVGIFEGSPEHVMYKLLMTMSDRAWFPYDKSLHMSGIWNAYWERRSITKAPAIKAIKIMGTPYGDKVEKFDIAEELREAA